jgi:magnesium transporter
MKKAMAPDLQHPTAGRGAPAATPASPAPSTSSPARVKTVACLGGVSLERGVPPEEIREHLRDADNVVWVDVQDPGPAEVAVLVDEFGFHPLSLEGAGEGQRRPKLDEYKGYLALVTYAAVPADAAASGAAGAGERRVAEVDLFIGRNYVVTLHRGRVAAVEEAAARWTRGGALLREGVGFLVYTLLDSLIDSFAPLISDAEDEIEEIEVGVFTSSDEEGVRELLRSKRTLSGLRRVLFPLREIFPSLLRRDHPFFHGATQVYLSDARDHLLRILDVLDAQRDMAAGALEASLAVSSHRLNKTMKTLALLTGAVAVMGAVFGAYGMNFQAVPLAEYRWGFWVVSAGTIAFVAAVALTGRWRKWW